MTFVVANDDGANVGEIVGYLRLNVDDWMANADRADARSKQVGDLAPTIKVGASTTSALALLDAVESRADRLDDRKVEIDVHANTVTTIADLVALDAELKRVASDADKIGPGGPGGPGGIGGGLGGLGADAESAGLSVSQFLIPALALASTTIGPLAAVGAAGFATLLLGSSQLEDQVKTGLTPAFDDLESTAATALGPGILRALDQVEQALPKLTPLVSFFGDEIGDAAAQLATWLNNGALTGFVDYAERELPIVEGAFVAVSKAGIDFFNAVTPLGNGLLGVLTDVANKVDYVENQFGHFGSGINGKPDGSIASQAGYAVSGNGGYKYSGGGPLGIENLPHNISTFFSTAGSPNGTLDNSKPPPLKATQQPVPASVILHATQSSGLQGPTLNSEAMQQATGGLGDAQSATDDAKALGLTASAYMTASAAAVSFKSSTAASAAEMQLENNAAGLLGAALQGLGGDALGVAQAQTQLKTGNLGLSATLKSNKDSLNENTTAGLANEAALQQQVSAAQAVYQATAQQTGSTVQAKAAYDAAVTSIENATGATGAQKQAIDAYVTSIATIPPVKSTQLDIDDAAALAAIANFQAQLAHTPGVMITSEAVSRSDAAGYSAHAAGGPLTEGWNRTGEDGIEWLFKSGSKVDVYNQAQMTMLGGSGGLQGPSVSSPAATAIRAANPSAASSNGRPMPAPEPVVQTVYRDITLTIDKRVLATFTAEGTMINNRCR